MELVSMCRAYCHALIRARVKDERGAALVEYALLLVLIAVLCLAAITLIGDTTNSNLSSSGSRLQ